MKSLNNISLQKGSFRDPCGFLFYYDGELYRQVNLVYQEEYDFLFSTGLYKKLTKSNFLIPHRELDNLSNYKNDAYKIIEPEKIHFISYPYEWSFSQLKDAAILTLDIQKIALDHGMTLKDASAYNIQFHKGKPIFIDTLSFEKYIDGQPWQAYRQFCQHFLAPLALMSKTDIRLNQLMKIYLDGIPLDLARKLLPFKTRLDLAMQMHIHLHARLQKKYEHKGSAVKKVSVPKHRLIALIHNLKSTTSKMQINKQQTEWGHYYSFTNYDDKSFKQKKEVLAGFVKKINPRTIWDIGANTGEFSKVACQNGSYCIAFDIDPLAVEYGYLKFKKEKVKNILPLIMDLTNPSPPIGWSNQERMGFRERPIPDLCIALALIHHLAISNNVPLVNIADFLSKLGDHLVIEFVPKSDSQVKRLLQSRTDIFNNYNEDYFISEFEKRYTVHEKVRLINSDRTMYWMKKR